MYFSSTKLKFFIMKKSDNQKRKLTKKQLKEINGGAGNDCLIECFCFTPDGEPRVGICRMDGSCC